MKTDDNLAESQEDLRSAYASTVQLATYEGLCYKLVLFEWNVCLALLRNDFLAIF